MSNEPANKVSFHEEQQFRQPWLWLLLGAMAAIFWYLLFLQLILPQPRGVPNSRSLTLCVFILWLLFGIAMPIFFYYLRLVTEVRTDGIYFRFYPVHFSFQRIGFDEIKRFEVRTYRPIAEYGGWGIRCGKGGKAYNVIGNRGVQLELTNGKKLLLGSQHSEQFVWILQNRDR